MKISLLPSLFLIFLLLSSHQTFAMNLEEAGWNKAVDDFEGTVSYTVDAKPWSYGCDGSTLSGAFGLVMGEPKNGTPLIIALTFYSTEDIRRSGDLRWKTASGTDSITFQCSNDYDDGGYDRQCITQGINKSIAKSLSSTSFVRIDFPAVNIDIKSTDDTNNKCLNMLGAIKRITSDYSQASS